MRLRRCSNRGGGAAFRVERKSHLQSCEVCRRAVVMDEEEELRLRRRRGAMRKASGPGCPAAAEWASLAAGLVEPARRDELRDHASVCDACGAVLRAMTEDFSEEMSEAELQE